MKSRWPVLLELLDTAGPRLHALLLRLTLREDVAEDLLQDLFVRLVASDGFLNASDRKAFAFRSAIHLALDWRRRRTRRKTSAGPDVEAVAVSPSPLASLIDREDLERILDAANELSEQSREVFVLRYVQQESYDVIAAWMGKTPQQVRGLAHRAVVGIRERVATEEPVPKTMEASNDHR